MSNASAQAPTAPEIVGAQNTLPDSQGTQKIRFLAGVSSLDGKKIGFEITAQFTHDNEYRTVTYSGSEYESRYVYTAVTAVGADGNYEAVSAQDLGKSYLCAISLTAVPTDIDDIFFTVRSYILYGEEKIYSPKKNFQWVNGTATPSDQMYLQDFEDISDTDSLAWTQKISNSWSAPLNITGSDVFAIKQDSNQNSYLDTVWGGSVKQITSMKRADKYSVEMDVNVTMAGFVRLHLNSIEETDITSDSIILDIHGANSNNTVLGATETESVTQMCVRAYRSGKGDVSAVYSSENSAIGFEKDIHLSVDVDNIAKKMGVYANGIKLFTYTIPDTNLESGGIYIQNQNALTRIDNVRIFARQYTGASADIKIMSLNVLNVWSHPSIASNPADTRDDLSAQKIMEILPDVVGLQEFDDYYRDTENGLSALISSKYAEVGAQQRSWNPIFYNTETIELLYYGFDTYSAGTEYNTYTGNSDGTSKFRTVTWAMFRHKQSQKLFIAVNTHLDTDRELVSTQCSEIIIKINALKTQYSVNTVFMTGDYNTNTAAQNWTVLLNGGFKDTRDIAIVKDNSNTSANKGQAVTGTYDNAIDHITYMGDNVSAKKYLTVSDIRDASDHCPIYVTVNLF